MKRRRQRRRGNESDSSDMSDVSDLSEGENTFIQEIFISPTVKPIKTLSLCPKPHDTFDVKLFKRILIFHIDHSHNKLQNYSVLSKTDMLLNIGFFERYTCSKFHCTLLGKIRETMH